MCAALEVPGTLREATVGRAEPKPTGGRQGWVEMLELRCCLMPRIVWSVEPVDRVEKSHL